MIAGVSLVSAVAAQQEQRAHATVQRSWALSHVIVRQAARWIGGSPPVLSATAAPDRSCGGDHGRVSRAARRMHDVLSH